MTRRRALRFDSGAINRHLRLDATLAGCVLPRPFRAKLRGILPGGDGGLQLLRSNQLACRWSRLDSDRLHHIRRACWCVVGLVDRGLSDVPVLAVSANASGSDEMRSRAAGANAFLSKPIDLDRLLLRVGELLKLTWTQALRSRDEPDDAHLVAPAVEELEALHRLAKIGHMRSIREQAERLGQLDAHLRSFANRLRSMADRFESRAIL